MIFYSSFIGNNWDCTPDFHFTSLLPGALFPSILMEMHTVWFVTDSVQTKKHNFSCLVLHINVQCILRRLGCYFFPFGFKENIYVFWKIEMCHECRILKVKSFYNPILQTITNSLVHIPQAFSIKILSYMHKYDMCMLEMYKIDFWLNKKMHMRLKPNITILEGAFEIWEYL